MEHQEYNQINTKDLARSVFIKVRRDFFYFKILPFLIVLIIYKTYNLYSFDKTDAGIIFAFFCILLVYANILYSLNNILVDFKKKENDLMLELYSGKIIKLKKGDYSFVKKEKYVGLILFKGKKKKVFFLHDNPNNFFFRKMHI